MINYIDGALNSVGDFSLSSKITSHEKDKEQQFQIGFLSWKRLSLLEQQWLSVLPNINTYSVSLVPIGLGVLSAVAAPLAKDYLEVEENQKNHPYLSNLCKMTVKAGEMGKKICQNANTLINTACCVSYVAMIALGHTALGVTGLTGLLLISIKRAGYLPSWLDRGLDPLAVAAETYVLWSMPMPSFIRGYLLLHQLGEGVDLLKRFEPTQRLLPNWILNPMPGTHVRKEKEEKIDFSNLKVNFSHIYNEKVNQVFPVDYKERIDAQKVSELFDNCINRFISLYKSRDEEVLSLDDLLVKEPEWASQKSKNDLIQRVLIEGNSNERAEYYDKITEEKKEAIVKVLEESNNKLDDLSRIIDDVEPLRIAVKQIVRDELEAICFGMNKLRSGVEHGRIEDELPPHFELFKRLMKAQMDAMTRESDAVFLGEFQLLSEMGSACATDGWLKQVSNLINVKTNDLEWAVHHQLAKMRGMQVNEKLLDIQEELVDKRKLGLSPVGGVLNAHVVNAAHCGVYPRFRTYEAEFYHQVNPREMDETIWVQMMNKTKERAWWLGDTLFMLHEMMHVHFTLLFYGDIFKKHFSTLDDEYTQEVIVDEIYESIKPKGGESKIPWNVVDEWLNSKGINKLDYLEGGTALNKKGVKLLLCDLGILE